MEKEIKRYQQCSWIEKLWRCRWRICTPFYAFWLWVTREVVVNDDTEECTPMSFSLCWAVASGHFECSKMHHYYTTEEVFSELRKKFNLDLPKETGEDI